MQLFCDFDGTITVQDATDFVLTALADPAWESIEQEWKRGKIGSAECMQRQIALIGGDKATLDATLDNVDIDPGFADFARFCQMSGVQITIISDGVDYFIRRILSRIGLEHLPVIANHLVIGENGFRLESPYQRMDCSSQSGVCKCKTVAAETAPRIYIGDGRSDFCVSSSPEIVFAKNALATYCAQNAIPFIGYRDFAEVSHALARILPGSIQPVAPQPFYAAA